MVDWPLVLGGLAAIVPALAILLATYQPYDGHFKDNVLFLFFMGGLFAGVAVSLFEFFLLLPRDAAFYTPIMVLLGFPLLEQVLKLVVLNKKKYQGERTTVFYGGSFGLGFGVMVVLYTSQRGIPLALYQDLGNVVGQPAMLLYLLAVGVGILLAHFATGLIVGDGVASRDLRGAIVRAILALVPVQFFVFEFTRGVAAGRGSEGLIYLPMLLAYTVALAWWASARLLPKGLAPDAQRKRRRALLQRRRAEAGREP